MLRTMTPLRWLIVALVIASVGGVALWATTASQSRPHTLDTTTERAFAKSIEAIEGDLAKQQKKSDGSIPRRGVQRFRKHLECIRFDCKSKEDFYERVEGKTAAEIDEIYNATIDRQAARIRKEKAERAARNKKALEDANQNVLP